MKTTSTTTSATITATIPTPFKRRQINLDSGVNMEEKEKKINGIVTDGVSNRFYAAEPFFLKWTVHDMVNLAKHHWLPCFFGFGLLFFMAVEYTLFMVPASSPPFDLGFIATRRLHGLLSSWPELNTVLAALNTVFVGMQTTYILWTWLVEGRPRATISALFQEQNTRAARLEKQLKARWKIEELIEEQLNRFPSNYNRAVFPARIQDVPKLLMPKWLLPHELTTLAWLGDWRPSCILDLVHALIQSSSFSLSPSSSNSNGVERLLSQLIHEIHIEEAIINEEMVEIQATCIVHLPFSPVRNHRSGATALSCIQAEFKKIERVITKAQQLRFKALELAVKKVLSQSDAAEFLVAFVGIQDVIHQLAAKQKLPKGPAIVPALAFGPA